MTKKLDEDSIHPSETAYDKAINRMEEREAHILNNLAMQIAASVAEQIRVQQAPLIQTLQPLQATMQPYHDFRHVGIFCVSVFRQNQEYHVINVHDGAYFRCLRLFWKVETVCAPVRRECRHSLPETLLQGNQPV